MADLLAAVLEDARTLGFLGPGDAAAHRRHAEGFLTLLEGEDVATAVDLGSGGGVPGLVLALALPQTTWTLLDAMAKRTAFLEDAVHRLGLSDRVQVRTARAEEAGRGAARGAADAVVARGFASPPVTAECAAPLLRVRGVLVVSEPPGGADRWPAAPLAELGLTVDRRRTEPPALIRLRQVAAVADRYPRRVGVPGKRPLWS